MEIKSTEANIVPAIEVTQNAECDLAEMNELLAGALLIHLNETAEPLVLKLDEIEHTKMSDLYDRLFVNFERERNQMIIQLEDK